MNFGNTWTSTSVKLACADTMRGGLCLSVPRSGVWLTAHKHAWPDWLRRARQEEGSTAPSPGEATTRARWRPCGDSPVSARDLHASDPVGPDSQRGLGSRSMVRSEPIVGIRCLLGTAAADARHQRIPGAPGRRRQVIRCQPQRPPRSVHVSPGDGAVLPSS